MSDVPAVQGSVTEADVAALTGLRLPKHQRFVAAYCSGVNSGLAVQAAGYTTKAPGQFATKLLHRPDIAAAVKAVREGMAKRAQFGQDKLVAAFDDAAQFAKETKNATALVRSLELKGKTLGLIIDRADLRVQQIPFNINITGIDEGKP